MNRPNRLDDKEKSTFAALVNQGKSQTQAYLAIRPDTTVESATVLGSRLAKQEDVKAKIRNQRLTAAEEIFFESTKALRNALRKVNEKLDQDEELSNTDTKIIAMGQALVVDAIGKEIEDTPSAIGKLLTPEILAALHQQGLAAISAARAEVAIDVTPVYDEREVSEALEDVDTQ